LTLHIETHVSAALARGPVCRISFPAVRQSHDGLIRSSGLLDVSLLHDVDLVVLFFVVRGGRGILDLHSTLRNGDRGHVRGMGQESNQRLAHRRDAVRALIQLYRIHDMV
jgi:hypothetical protein